MRCVAVSHEAVGSADRIAVLAASFPHVHFESFGEFWLDPLSANFDIAIVAVDAASLVEMNWAEERLRARLPGTQIIVVLRNANVETSRRLARGGAADVLPAPASEPTLALSIERLLRRERDAASPASKSGQIAAILKAGGGVGATSLATQITAILSRRGGEAHPVCLADLDLQFGEAALYLNVCNAFSVTDCLAAGSALEESPFATALATKHSSGARLLAAPQLLDSMDMLSPELVSKLLYGLKQTFALTVLDLPPVWTAWSNRAVQLSNRIFVVTRLSVPHVHLVRRQLAMLATQQLDDRPVVLVCNAVNSEQQSMISIKTAERAIGRPFDLVIPEDNRVMYSAINRGMEISDVKRGTKLERAIVMMAESVASDAFAGPLIRA
jgi:pilus assembly protein CpaE